MLSSRAALLMTRDTFGLHSADITIQQPLKSRSTGSDAPRHRTPRAVTGSRRPFDTQFTAGPDQPGLATGLAAGPGRQLTRAVVAIVHDNDGARTPPRPSASRRLCRHLRLEFGGPIAPPSGL